MTSSFRTLMDRYKGKGKPAIPRKYYDKPYTAPRAPQSFFSSLKLRGMVKTLLKVKPDLRYADMIFLLYLHDVRVGSWTEEGTGLHWYADFGANSMPDTLLPYAYGLTDGPEWLMESTSFAYQHNPLVRMASQLTWGHRKARKALRVTVSQYKERLCETSPP